MTIAAVIGRMKASPAAPSGRSTVSAASGSYAAELSASSQKVATRVTGPIRCSPASSDASGRPRIISGTSGTRTQPAPRSVNASKVRGGIAGLVNAKFEPVSGDGASGKTAGSLGSKSTTGYFAGTRLSGSIPAVQFLIRL